MKVDRLPNPPAAMAEHSHRVRAHIANRIRQLEGGLDFSEFMELALYAPGLGYYVNGTAKLGRGGDFVTAPELGGLFGAAIASQCVAVLSSLENASVLEYGAGSGALCEQILTRLDEAGKVPETYLILEVSPELKARQHERLSQLPVDLAGRVRWIDSLPEHFSGVVIANEVLDAIPVSRFTVRDNRGFARLVTESEDELAWGTSNKPDSRLDSLVQRYELPHGYVSEMCHSIYGWIRSLVNCLDQALILLVDYGYPGREYYHPERRQGTLRCHYQQFAHDDPFRFPGIQDITAHVDFTAVAEAALAEQLQLYGFTNLAGFILSTGIIETVDMQSFTIEQQMRLSNELKRLTLPSEMGEVFKVMALSRDIDVPLSGFRLQDARHRLEVN